MKTLDKNSEKILKELLIHSQSNNVNLQTEFFQKYDTFFLNDILRNLHEEKYIHYFDSFEEPVTAVIFNKGLTYFECKRNDNLKSIFNPIVISVLSNIVIDVLRWLLLCISK